MSAGLRPSCRDPALPPAEEGGHPEFHDEAEQHRAGRRALDEDAVQPAQPAHDDDGGQQDGTGAVCRSMSGMVLQKPSPMPNSSPER